VQETLVLKQLPAAPTGAAGADELNMMLKIILKKTLHKLHISCLQGAQLQERSVAHLAVALAAGLVFSLHLLRAQASMHPAAKHWRHIPCSLVLAGH
jgi:hypothetical protein